MPASLSFAKIVATPTETAWSQVYHAGNLFALVSLTTEKDGTDLNALGKEMFNALESNFFSLEKKTLTTITEVIEESLNELPSTVTVSACIAFSREAILYLFLVGDGDILTKRGEKIGSILSLKTNENRSVHTSSGYLKHDDVILMQTGAFSRLLEYDTVVEALDATLPNDVIEKLNAQVKDNQPGDASAVTLLYQGTSSPDALTPAQEMRRTLQETSPLETVAHKATDETEDEETLHPALTEKDAEEKEIDEEESDVPSEKEASKDDEQEEEDEEEKTEIKDTTDEEAEEETQAPEEPPVRLSESEKDEHAMNAWQKEHDSDEEEGGPEVSPVTVTKRGLPSLPLPSRRILFGTIAVILLGVLLFAIFFTKQAKQTSQTKSVFTETYNEASQKYDEAEGLKNLNASLAQDDYKKAEAIIKAGLPKVQKGSDEEKKLQALLAKVEQNIVSTEGTTVTPKAVDLSESPLLSLAVDASSAYVATDGSKQYALTSKSIREGDKSIIANDSDWTVPAGLGAYNGNIYVLDKKAGILKFTAGSGGYGKSSYFGDGAPNLSSAVSMAIDGSIYVLFSDGTIKKYTKGKEDSFVTSGLPSPLSSPKEIVTSVDSSSLYILDSGNSRVIQLSKEGAFQKAWKATVLSSASLIDVQESEKKIYILKGKNLFMLSME